MRSGHVRHDEDDNDPDFSSSNSSGGERGFWVGGLRGLPNLFSVAERKSTSEWYFKLENGSWVPQFENPLDFDVSSVF